MQTIFSYAAKSFRRHMGLGVVFIIALAVAMISTVLGIAASIQQSIYKQTISVSSNFHAQYTHLTQEQVDIITKDNRVAWVDERLTLRENAITPGSGDPIGLFSSSGFQYQEGFTLQWGHSPKEKYEAMLSPYTAKALGLTGTPGEPFALDVQAPFGASEKITFTLSGLLSESVSSDIYFGASIYISEALARERGDFGSTYREAADPYSSLSYRILLVHFKDGISPRETAHNLAAEAGITEKEDTRINEGYLQASLNDPSTMTVAGIALGILLLTGILIIHSAFSIVVVKRSRQLGLLRLVGATKGQLTLCVLLEGLFSLLLALPLGLLLGAGLTWLGIPACAALLGNMVAVTFYMPVWAFGLAALLALVMVLFGALIPARRAGKITPVEAVQFTIPREKAARRKYSGDLTLSRLAQINLKRSKSRTRGILTALSISGILFLGISAIGFSMLDSVDERVRSSSCGDIAIHSGRREGSSIFLGNSFDLTDSLLRQIEAIDGVERIDAFYSQTYNYTGKPNEQGLYEIGNLIGANETAFREILESIPGAPPLEAFQAPGTALAFNDNSPRMQPFNLNTGETRPFYPLNGANLENDGNTTTLDILAVNDRRIPFPTSMLGGANPPLLMLQETYLAAGFAPTYTGASLYIDETKHDSVTTALTALLQPYELYYESTLDKKQDMVNQLMGMLSLVFVIVFLVAVLGILNLVSATCIGIEQRQREFGVLYALGLGKRGLRGLLNRESLVISVKSVLISCGIGLALGFAFFRVMTAISDSSYRFSFPLLPLLGLCLVFGLAPRITTYFASRRLLRQTPVELLGHEL